MLKPGIHLWLYLFSTIKLFDGLEPSTAATEYMPEGYNKILRPGFYEDGDADDVAFDMFIHAVGPVEEAQMRMSLDMYFRVYWKDERLVDLYQHLSNETNTTGPIYLGETYLELLWHPDIYWMDALSVEKPGVTSDSLLIKLQSDGSVFFSTRLLIKFRCHMALKYFPMDIQKCSLCFQSYLYHDGEQNMTWRSTEISFSEDQTMANFVLDNNPKVSLTVLAYGTGVNYSTLCTTVKLSRKVNMYIINMCLPSISLVMLSWVGFWIDKKAVPARAGLCITTVLAQITLIIGTANQFPGISDVKLADLYLIVNFFYVFASLIEFAIVSYGRSVQFAIQDNFANQKTNKPTPGESKDDKQLVDANEVVFLGGNKKEPTEHKERENADSIGKASLFKTNRVAPTHGDETKSFSSDEHKPARENSVKPFVTFGERKPRMRQPLREIRLENVLGWIVLYFRKENADEISKWFFPLTFFLWNFLYFIINLKFSGRI